MNATGVLVIALFVRRNVRKLEKCFKLEERSLMQLTTCET